MKKSIKLIITCLLLCICWFGVISCSNNTNSNNDIKLKVDKSLEKRSISNYSFDVDSSTITIFKEKQDGWNIENYKGLSKTIRNEIKEDTKEDIDVKIELKDGDKTIIIKNGVIQ